MTARAMTVSDAVVDVMEIDGTRRVVTHSPAIVAISRAMKQAKKEIESLNEEARKRGLIEGD